MPDRSNFFSVRLAAEATAVASKIATYLATFIHLTLSFDGWSSKGHDEIYSVHITTPLRSSFFVEGLILTGLSTTGDALFGYLSEVCLVYFFARITEFICRGRLSYDTRPTVFP